jgi:DNA-binding response OmpR family regulator
MNDSIRKRILVVDDEEDVREYLKTALEDAGFLVSVAKDGLEALDMVRQNPPDLISLDLVMPQHSGARFHRDLQKDKRWSKIPVLVVTGHARDELGKADLTEMTMSGPGVYLEKPVRPDSYVAAVRSLLGEPAPQPEAADTDRLRNELLEALSTADQRSLQRALETLKKR